MRKLALFLILAIVASVLVVGVDADQAWARHHFHGGGGRVFIGFGPGYYPYPYYGYYPYPYYPYYPPTVYSSPVIVQEQPTTYVQQSPAPAASYWYYCQSSRAYYPSVATCPEAWLRVAPR
jgi:hypothetical protein